MKRTFQRSTIALPLLLATMLAYGGYSLQDGQWRLYRSNVMDTTFAPSSYPSCRAEADRRTRVEAQSGRTTGSIPWRCSVPITGRFNTTPMTCGPLPLAQTRVAQCPVPYIGTFGQTAVYHPRPWPECSVFSGDWQPTAPPSGICAVPLGAALLSWTPPTENTDGSALTDLAGYIVHYGTSSEALTNSFAVSNPGATSHLLTGLTPGTYYFAVVAVNSKGAASPLSEIKSKVVR